MKKLYKLAALGGTFDHFHKGHQTLIKHAFNVSEKVIIGISCKELIHNKHYASQIQNYLQRKNNVLQFLKENNLNINVQIIKLKNIFGPTLNNSKIEALIVSPLTKPGADLINQTRENRKLKLLDISICNLEKAFDGQHISSTRIRKGEIDTNGFVYRNLLKKTIIISDSQRLKLKKPLGRLYKNQQRYKLIPMLEISTNIAIGDATSEFCYQQSIPVRSFVYDQHIQRQRLQDSIRTHLISSDIIQVRNKPGIISKNLSKSIQIAYQKHKHLQIEGEEDLAVISAILLLPLGSIILYGQPNKGLVLVTVTVVAKDNIRKILEK